ncbi:hypothetical protein [Lapidilactobacillus gannanensis]|jgi:competence protein ComGC|uniref:XRE family transcriptional regulator n=1 Tax=Lapidilactobacillus gannanensis TaxID=2486002 RepID=A0ABW4BNM2_9LACO|nr:hypothetical protein [Lapidilactobacillus gannanensis]MCH4057879.1 hypothetical protein [Lactobacillaceae bacterium]
MPKKQRRDYTILVLIAALFFAAYFWLARFWQANKWFSIIAMLILIFIISLAQRVRLQQQREKVNRVLTKENLNLSQLATAVGLDQLELKGFIEHGALPTAQRYRLEEFLDQHFPND